MIFVGEDQRAPKTRRFRVGVAFEKLPPDQEKALAEFIEEELEGPTAG